MGGQAMLSVIKRLRANLKRKQSEKVSQGFPRYREILQAIVDGNEDSIDAEELNQALEDVGKDFEQLEADTKLLEKRLAWHREMLDGQQAASELPKATERLKVLQAELQGHQERLKPLIAEAARVQQELHTRVSNGSTGLWHLERIENHLDRGLVDRIAAIDAEVRQALKERQRFAEDIRLSNSQYSPANALAYAKSRVEKWMRIAADAYGKDKYRNSQLAYWRNIVAVGETKQQSLKDFVESLDRDIEALRAEREALAAELTKP